MKPSISNLLQALRHVAVGVAVLAVLMMSFRIHLHAGATATGDCPSTVALWTVLGDVITDLAEPSSPDQDPSDVCDCPSPTISVPHDTAINLFTMASPLARLTHPSVAPENVSYPPDPPPARLS